MNLLYRQKTAFADLPIEDVMKTALLVIDYIYGIVEGSCQDYIKAHSTIENTNKLIDYYRAHNMPIYFVRLGFDKNYTACPNHSRAFQNIKSKGLFQLGQHDTDFVKELHYQSHDVVVNKTAASPFHCDQEFIKNLQSQNIECLIFTGLATDNAINLGVREAHDMGYYTIVAEDACGGSSEDFHKWAILLLDKIANEIILVDELIK